MSVVVLLTRIRTNPFGVDTFSSPPEAQNDNFPVKGRWQTPAEAIQTIERWLEEMRREMQADFTLRSSPEYRFRWEQMNAMHKCAYWVYLRVRKD